MEKKDIHFWAKITKEGKPGISVYSHMMNVGCVARCLSEMHPTTLRRFGLCSTQIGALAALHDLGKISPGFQRKCEAWLEENGLTKDARNGCWDTMMESAHSKVSHAAIQEFLGEQGIDRTTAKFVSTVLAAHHGRLTRPNDRGYRPQGAMSETYSCIDWDAERKANAKKTWDYLGGDSTCLTFSESSPALWWLAGLTSVADWIGSDERFFPLEKSNGSLDCDAAALKALKAIDFQQEVFVQNLSFHELFHDAGKPRMRWVPNDMQEKTFATVNGPGVYVIEAPMGTGKTEAALWASYRLLISGKATGVYFALPTQATSNRMHLRMDEFVRRICGKISTTRLIHGSSWLMDQTCTLSPVATSPDSANEDARAGRDWFASSKRALLASFGVGTVDQALLGIVAAKHFFVRQFALAGKVVILDEVHSYDLYTGTLIDRLIETLEGLGCTVIVLSATLSGKRRGQIVALPDGNDTDDSEQPYPLIAGRQEGIVIEPVAAKQPESRTVGVDFIAVEDGMKEAIQTAQNGGAVLWICDTVDAAQKQYRRFIERSPKSFPIGLLHSRFPFYRREELENEWMTRFGKDGTTRCGSILISTQIVEQSVDLDADLLVTELAPTDMLLQRLGRLWRHERGRRAVDTARFCIINERRTIEEFRRMEPKLIIETLGSKARVYAPYILLRSLEVWKAQAQILMPAQIRQLIERTYQDRGDETEAWQTLSNDWFGTDSAKKMMAARNSNLWQVALEDEEGVQTRLNEMPTVSVVLCRSINRNEAMFMGDTTGILDRGTFRLAMAQAIHENMAKVPKYCFDYIEPCSLFADYIRGEQAAGVVAENGIVDVKGLRNGICLSYSGDLGLVIEKTTGKENS